MPDNSSANVQAIAALEELRAALVRFQSEAQGAVSAAAPEITTALDWLQERLRYWQRELRLRQEALEQARRALARCEENCGGLAEAVRRAERKVQEAQEALRIVQQHIKRVGEAHASFQRQAHRLGEVLTSGELPKATALLKKSISILESYTSMRAPSGSASANSGGESISLSSAGSSGSGSSVLQNMLSAPLSTALKTGAALFAASVIVGASVIWPFDTTADIPGMSEASASSAPVSASPLQEVAKDVKEMVDGAWDAQEEVRVHKAEIEAAIQQGQNGPLPPEKA